MTMSLGNTVYGDASEDDMRVVASRASHSASADVVCGGHTAATGEREITAHAHDQRAKKATSLFSNNRTLQN